ncbi:MAG: phosphatase PAP2 family protein [Humibacillus sp.]|nr:phosphatase PAP2 family protein [Humibacillus sp.]MDN5778037.1 phosphatase PAP2 family protein [Humibacillus sp.]
MRHGPDRWTASEHAVRARAAALALLVAYIVVRLVPLVSRIDEGLRGVHDGNGIAAGWAGALLGTMTPVSVVVIALLLCGLAWRRYGLRASVESALTIAVGPGLAELFKDVLPVVGHHSEAHWVIGSSFPSGHTAIVTVLCLTLLVVAPSRSSSFLSTTWGRMLRLLAFALPVAIGVSTVIVGWHQPGDVVGGVLVALAVHHGVRAVSRRRATTGTPSLSATS